LFFLAACLELRAYCGSTRPSHSQNRYSFVAAAVAWFVSYVVRCSEHVACCVLSKGCCELLFCFKLALGWCTHRSCGVPCGVPCVVQHAACRAVAYCSFCGFCFVAHCVHVGCCCHHRATVRHAHVQEDRGGGTYGGVLHMISGSATFESVEISDTTAEVRVAGEADRVGGGLGRRRAGRWRGGDGRRVSRVQGRQHRTRFGGARSSWLRVVRVAWICMVCDASCFSAACCAGTLHG
jgi:hypothetical protein